MAEVFHSDPLNLNLFDNSKEILLKLEISRDEENCYFELKNLVEKIQSKDETARKSKS